MYARIRKACVLTDDKLFRLIGAIVTPNGATLTAITTILSGCAADGALVCVPVLVQKCARLTRPANAHMCVFIHIYIRVAVKPRKAVG